MRVLITGAAGFAGRHTTAELARRGATVTGTDVVPAPPPGPGAPAGWVAADLCRVEDALRAVEASAPDAILHLAGQPRVGASYEDPGGTLRLNVGTTLNVLEAARRAAPAARVLLISSCEVYGEVPPDRLPIAEDAPFQPISPYGVSKCTLEFLGRAWRQTHGLHVAILRPFNHTGPGQAPHFVCADFARQIALAEAGRIPPVVTTGRTSYVRDFLDIRDVAAAYGDAIEKGLPPGEAFNIASGRGIPLREALDLLLGMARRALDVREAPDRIRSSDIPVLIGDASRFRRLTGWAPRFGLRQTLADLLEDMRARATSPAS
jgi:GDP-4-dehydro-6-deoxy-D-mannose reductase